MPLIPYHAPATKPTFFECTIIKINKVKNISVEQLTISIQIKSINVRHMFYLYEMM